MNIDLTESEGRALLEMLDAAVRSGGLRYAAQADAIARKVVAAKNKPGKAEQTLEVVAPNG